MYETGTVLGASTVAGGIAAVTMLPSTGGELVQVVSISMTAGLLTWAVIYKLQSKKNNISQ